MATVMKVPTIFTAVDKFSDVVSRMSKSVSAFGETAQASAMRTSRGLNSFGTSMLTGGVAIATGLGYAINEAGKFEKAMASVNTLTDDTPIQMKAMGDSVLEMAKKVPVPISDLTEGLYDVVSAGIRSQYQLKVLKDSAILAVAGLGTTKEAVNITTSALNAFSISGSKASDVTNLLMKAVKYGKTTVSGLSEGFGANAALIKNSNVSLEEYLATTATLTTTGMTAARAQTQVSSAVTALIKPSKNMQLVLDKLGAKNIPLFIKRNGGLVKTLQLVRDKADEMGIMTSKAFGRKEGFSALLSLLGPLRNKFIEVMNDMQNHSNNVIGTAFEKQQKTFSAGVQRMKNGMGALAIKIGEELIPRVNGFIESLTSGTETVLEFVKNNGGLVTVLADVALGMLTIGALAKVGAAFFYSYAKGIQAYKWALDLGTKAILRWQLASLTAMETGGSFIVALLGWPAIIALGVVALGGLAYAMSISSETVDKFAKNNEVHLNIVSGGYETMESRIARSNARIVADMKKFKLDLESVEKTGKTVAEVAADKIAKTTHPAIKERMKTDMATKVSSTMISKPKVLGIREVSKEELSGAINVKHKNIAGTINPLSNDLINSIKGVSGTVKLIVESKDGSKVDVDTTKAKGVKVITTPTQGQRH